MIPLGECDDGPLEHAMFPFNILINPPGMIAGIAHHSDGDRYERLLLEGDNWSGQMMVPAGYSDDEVFALGVARLRRERVRPMNDGTYGVQRPNSAVIWRKPHPLPANDSLPENVPGGHTIFTAMMSSWRPGFDDGYFNYIRDEENQ